MLGYRRGNQNPRRLARRRAKSNLLDLLVQTRFDLHQSRTRHAAPLRITLRPDDVDSMV